MRDNTRRRMQIAVVTGAVAAGSIAAAVPAMAATTSVIPACKAANVKVTLGHVDPGAGQRYAHLNFRNTGKKACVLRNGLKGFTYLVKGKEGGARSVPVHAYGDKSLGYSAKQSVVLTSGKHGKVGHLVIHWNVMSVPTITPQSLRFALPAGGGHTALPWKQLVGGDHRLGLGRLSA
ncbi:DUF4232 domain-containing protein [Actinoallomurus sp. NPDC050550]|uniref:DUF4232 domain-containing protein n=1 Tax=Actinoallomurus sp. NPDC050550 TaxID=3154937 RepID=UPI0033CA4C25